MVDDLTSSVFFSLHLISYYILLTVPEINHHMIPNSGKIYSWLASDMGQ